MLHKYWRFRLGRATLSRHNLSRGSTRMREERSEIRQRKEERRGNVQKTFVLDLGEAKRCVSYNGGEPLESHEESFADVNRLQGSKIAIASMKNIGQAMKSIEGNRSNILHGLCPAEEYLRLAIYIHQQGILHDFCLGLWREKVLLTNDLIKKSYKI